MYHPFSVPIPQEKGKISRQKAKSAIYIHYVLERSYDPQKKHTVPKRTIIGRLDENQSTHMYPNDEFFRFFPSTALPEARQDARRSSTLSAGAYLVIDKIIKEYELDKIIARHFGKNAGLFLDLVAFVLIEQRNQGQYYPDYAYRHPLFTSEMQVLSDSTVSAFLASVTDDQIAGGS